jgi:hypothetical protein
MAFPPYPAMLCSDYSVSVSGTAQRAFPARLGLIDRYVTARKYRAVELLDRFIRLGVICHLHESKALRLA